MTSAIPMSTRMRQGSPACCAEARPGLPLFAGLNFAIFPMVASRFEMERARINVMKRRVWLLLPFGLAACRRAAPDPNLFPKTVPGGWQLTELRVASVSDAPDPVPRSAVERIQIASYQGPGKLEARAYLLDSPAAGEDIQRRWHPSSDTVFFARAQYFVVVKWQSADRQALRAFVRDLETRIQPAAVKKQQ